MKSQRGVIAALRASSLLCAVSSLVCARGHCSARVVTALRGVVAALGGVVAALRASPMPMTLVMRSLGEALRRRQLSHASRIDLYGMFAKVAHRDATRVLICLGE